MFLTLWRKLTNRTARASRRGHTPARRRPSCRLEVESLETRLVPATHTWIGTPNGVWSNPSNWSGGTPAGDSAADLVFPDDSAGSVSGQIISVNDLSGLSVRTITLTNNIDQYSIGGNPITLGGDILDVGGPGTVTNLVSLDIALASSQHNIACLGGRSLYLSGQLSSSGVTFVDKWGAGFLTTLGHNTYTGPTSINGGFLSAYLPANSAVTVKGGAEWDLPAANINGWDAIGSLAGSGEAYLNGNSLTVGGDNISTAWSGTMIGTGSLVKAGTGTFTLEGFDSYTGGTTIAAGTLENVMGLPSVGTVTVDAGATLQMNDSIDDAGSLAGAGTVNLVDCNFSVGEDNTSTMFSGVLSGSGTLDKDGSGTFILTGPTPVVGRVAPRIYLSGIDVVGGTVQLGVNNVIASTCAVTVEAGPLFGTSPPGSERPL